MKKLYLYLDRYLPSMNKPSVFSIGILGEENSEMRDSS